ncbi:MAG: NAD-dependent epimerase/dehydratase family protein, partial [Guyparkeria sp.]
MHVLITGGAGFIGVTSGRSSSAQGGPGACRRQLSTGSLDNISPHLTHPEFRFTEDDIVTWPDLNEVVSGADRIYHMAAVVGVFRV